MNIYRHRTSSLQADEHGSTAAGEDGSNKPITGFSGVWCSWSFHCIRKTLKAECVTFSEIGAVVDTSFTMKNNQQDATI